MAPSRPRAPPLLPGQVLDHLRDGVVAWDADGYVVAWNRAAERLFGRAATNALGRSVAEVLPLPPDATAEARLHRGEAATREVTLAREGQAPSTFQLHVVPLRDARGQLVATVAAATDVTERSAVERELHAARRALAKTEKLTALGTLVGGVAHEVRTPLAYIATNLHILKARLIEAADAGRSAGELLAEIEPQVDDALQGVDRINRLVLELRRFAKPPATGRVRMPLHEPVAAAVDFFRATAQGRAHVSAVLGPTPPVLMEPTQVQQVVLNLLDNAADAAPGSTLRVETRLEGEHALLAVRDEGPGISREVQARVFEAFYTTKPQGMGLGLAIVQRIVHDHGGSLWLDSAEGKGTTVYARFPLSRA